MSEAPAGGRAPDFICIGAQKAGTTWLNANLQLHPDVWIAPVKEVHYFDSLHMPWTRAAMHEFRQQKAGLAMRRYLRTTDEKTWDYRFVLGLADIMRGELSDEWYRSIFAVAPVGSRCGEITPDYSILPDAGIDHVIRMAPGARIILILRDPIDRAWSCVRMIAERLGVRDPARIIDIARLDLVRQLTDYPTMLARWRAKLQPGQLMVAMYDKIVWRPAEFLRRVCVHIGVPFDASYFPEADKAVFRGPELALTPEANAYLKESLRPIYDWLAGEFPDVTARWVVRHYG